MSETKMYLESVLESVPIHCVCVGDAVEGTVRQEYVNTYHTPIEIVYTYPTLLFAAITGLGIQIGNRKIETEIMDKALASQRYARAIADGNSAFMLESERPNINRVTLGRVEPGERIVAETHFSMVCEKTGNGVRIAIPTAIAPRYLPCNAVGREDIECIFAPLGNAEYTVDFSMEIEPLGRVVVEPSPSHDMDARAGDNGKWWISMKNGTCRADRDIVVLYHYMDEASKSYGVLGEGGSESILMARFASDIAPAQLSQNCAYSFILDCSGSMGSSFEDARAALEEALGYLHEGDMFQVICFNERIVYLPCIHMNPFNSQTLESAVLCMSDVRADGGTEIEAPLRFVLEENVRMRRNIIMITDGLVQNDREIISMVRKRIRENTRFFTVGIGNAANSYLMSELAVVGSGFAEHVVPTEDCRRMVERQMMRCVCSRVERVRLSWADGTPCSDIEPQKPREILNGDTVQFMLRLCGDEQWPLILSGRIDGREWARQLNREDVVPGSCNFFGKVFARQRIARLEQDFDYCENDHVKKELKRKGRELSLKYGVLSRWTTFFSEMLRDPAGVDIPRTVYIPTMLACNIRQPKRNVWCDSIEDAPLHYLFPPSNGDLCREERRRSFREFERKGKNEALDETWNRIRSRGGFKRYRLYTDRCLHTMRMLWGKLTDIRDDAMTCRDLKEVAGQLIDNEQLAGFLNINDYNTMLLMMDEYLGIYAIENKDEYMKRIIEAMRNDSVRQIPSWLQNSVLNFLNVLVLRSECPEAFQKMIFNTAQALCLTVKETDMKETAQAAFLISAYHRRYNSIKEW